MSDRGRLEEPGRELVEERLERVVVVPVDEDDVGVGFLQLLCGADPANPPPRISTRGRPLPDIRTSYCCCSRGSIPHVLVINSPGWRWINDSPVRNALGGQVIGSTAMLRLATSGSGSPVKTMRYG